METGLPLADVAEPDSAESPEPESQPVPDPTADHDALAEHNRELKRKLRHAVTVANGCARALEREKASAMACNRVPMVPAKSMIQYQ